MSGSDLVAEIDAIIAALHTLKSKLALGGGGGSGSGGGAAPDLRSSAASHVPAAALPAMPPLVPANLDSGASRVGTSHVTRGAAAAAAAAMPASSSSGVTNITSRTGTTAKTTSTRASASTADTDWTTKLSGVATRTSRA